MYKIDPSLIKTNSLQIHFNYEDHSKNQTKYDSFSEFFGILIAASAPNNETTSDSTYTTKTWSILSKTGVELCVIGDKLKFQNYEQILKDLLEQSQIKARDARIDNNPRLAKEAKMIEVRFFEALCEPIIDAAAKEPALVEFIPDYIFEKYPEIETQLIKAREKEVAKTKKPQTAAERKSTLIARLAEMD